MYSICIVWAKELLKLLTKCKSIPTDTEQYGVVIMDATAELCWRMLSNCLLQEFKSNNT